MLTTRFTQVKETCLYFADLELARHFYHEKLGLPEFFKKAYKKTTKNLDFTRKKAKRRKTTVLF